MRVLITFYDRKKPRSKRTGRKAKPDPRRKPPIRAVQLPRTNLKGNPISPAAARLVPPLSLPLPPTPRLSRSLSPRRHGEPHAAPAADRGAGAGARSDGRGGGGPEAPAARARRIGARRRPQHAASSNSTPATSRSRSGPRPGSSPDVRSCCCCGGPRLRGGVAAGGGERHLRQEEEVRAPPPFSLFCKVSAARPISSFGSLRAVRSRCLLFLLSPSPCWVDQEEGGGWGRVQDVQLQEVQVSQAVSFLFHSALAVLLIH